MRVLIVEDNDRLAGLLKRGLVEQGFTVDAVTHGHDGEARAASDTYDIIILDLMLPDHDGVQICRNLRTHGINTPILMLTALGSTEQKVAGFEAGADDYLTKPFELEELVLRLRAIARRAHGNESGSQLRFNDIEMNLLRREVRRNGEKLSLTQKEFALLEYFLRHPHRVLSKTQLGTRVWDMNYEDDSNVIEVYISRLRSKIDKPFDPKLLHTVVGAGYMLSDEPPAAI